MSGGFTSVSFKPEGSRIARGSSLGGVEGPRHFDVVRAPLECRLVKVNQDLFANPSLLSKDPFGMGWFAIVEPSGPASSLVQLPAVAAQIEAKLRSLGIKCFADFPDREMFEIGVECSAVLVQLNDLMSVSPSGTTVHVVSDDPSADVEMLRWQDQTGNLLLESSKEGSVHHFIVKKS